MTMLIRFTKNGQDCAVTASTEGILKVMSAIDAHDIPRRLEQLIEKGIDVDGACGELLNEFIRKNRLPGKPTTKPSRMF